MKAKEDALGGEGHPSPSKTIRKRPSRAQIYRATHQGFNPDRFSGSTRKKCRKAKEALGDGEGWAARLLGSTSELCHYVLRSDKHLSLPKRFAAPSGFFDPAVVKAIREAIKSTLCGPLWWRLEVSENHLHVHVLADRYAGLPWLPRDGRLIRPVTDLEGLLRYLSKCPLPRNDAFICLYLERQAEAKRLGTRLPRTSGTMGLPSRQSWHSKIV